MAARASAVVVCVDIGLPLPRIATLVAFTAAAMMRGGGAASARPLRQSIGLSQKDVTMRTAALRSNPVVTPQACTKAAKANPRWLTARGVHRVSDDGGAICMQCPNAASNSNVS